MERRYRNGWWLEQKYHREGWTQAEIAAECGVSPSTVRDWMRRRGIETRDLEGENHPLYGESRDESVKEAISNTLNNRDVSDETRERMSNSHLGNKVPEEARQKISEALSGREKSEETRKRMSESRTGADNPLWKGGHAKNYGPGWVRARADARGEDPKCDNCGSDGSDRSLDVHHIVPVRLFERSEKYEIQDAHTQGNLVVLCRQCHMRAEHGDLEYEPDPDVAVPDDYRRTN